MKLWGGRFTKETNQLVHNFNESLSYDRKFLGEVCDKLYQFTGNGLIPVEREDL